jgi:hypothetical protein
VAFDALGGEAIDDLAELLDEDGTIINFGSLETRLNFSPSDRQRVCRFS